MASGTTTRSHADLCSTTGFGLLAAAPQQHHRSARPPHTNSTERVGRDASPGILDPVIPVAATSQCLLFDLLQGSRLEMHVNAKRSISAERE
ncbi:uncharacterized protein SEPMUDRAFT_116167 [Sphaerulina musiva SO2202]|uniref:Uncharacterized protein n=1 Tax=Sphaerulina musiva (strain SO2202) TaxID=692275 RepID=M3D5E1_SPHMS|nr:uncharacterized protein SEPMUDRAFT_116167 [Sphaerulina musiva SO2202]EMF13104.1 hypothetical protein SEPMUDRAFT_116167 [Sphaerulina musiva SO2202]